MGIEPSCESHADMSDPALYIHSMEKLDLVTRKRLISQGAFQPKAHEMNEKRFPTSRCGSHDRSFSESWYYTKVGKNNIRRKWLSYSPKEDAVFCHFSLFFVAVIRNKRSQRSVIGIGKRLMRSLQKHEKSHCHIGATVDFHNFCFHIPVNEQLSNEAA